jgi:hypothetical protein
VASKSSMEISKLKTYIEDTAERTGNGRGTIAASLLRAEVPNIETAPEAVPTVALNKVASIHGKGARKAKEAALLKKPKPK